MRANREAEFRAYMLARWAPLVRSATLLTGDRAAAEDIVQSALAKAWLAWGRIRKDDPDAYVRRIVVTTHLSARSRRWTGEIPTALLPETAGRDETSAVLDRAVLAVLARALADLTARQRAVMVLRYFDDLTDRQTAEALGCSISTVKTLASRAIVRLRAVPGLADADENQRKEVAQP